MSVLSQNFHATQNVWILPNYAFPGTIVVKSVNFEPNLNGTENFWIFGKFHPQVPSGQKSDFWTKFLTWLKISGFCQISSFAGPAWSKISFLSQIFQHLSKFLDFAKFHPSQVQSGQNSQFWANFKRDWKFLNFIKFHPSHVPSGQKCMFFAKFSTRLKISGFCSFSSFTCPVCSEFYQISSFACPKWSKMYVFCQIFIKTQNFWILANFHPSQVLCGQKSLIFQSNFQHNSKFLDFVKFHPLQILSGRNWVQGAIDQNVEI